MLGGIERVVDRFDQRGMARRAFDTRAAGRHSPTASHIPTATTATTTAHHTMGVTRFELPLRGESLAAWLNS